MRKLIVVPLCVLLLATAACGKPAEEEPFSAAFTIRPEQEATEIFFDSTYTGETQVLRDDALDYDALRELFAQALFGDEAQTAARWTVPLQYAMEGSFTEQDSIVASELAMELVRVDGFPGMRETAAGSANVHFRFSSTTTPSISYDVDPSGRIVSLQILIPATYQSAQRAATMRQYLMRGCGFFCDTQTTLDSVLAAEDPAPDLSDADFILLNTLYGSIEPGTNKSACLQAFDRYFAQ